MITIIYQFKHNVTWHCRINQFFSFPEQLQIWIYVFLVGDHRCMYLCLLITIARACSALLITTDNVNTVCACS